MNRLAAYPELADVIGRGDTKMSIRTHKGLQIDVRVVPAESFGAALAVLHGLERAQRHRARLAKQRGLKINEYGVYRVDGDEEVYVAGATEEDVYATLDLPWFPPEMREARKEFEWAAAGELPELISVDDIRGDLHMHTTATDGRATLDEMVAAARERGLQLYRDYRPFAASFDGPRVGR
jgi:DNA polymerase (family X)